jgi:maleate isomerase
VKRRHFISWAAVGALGTPGAWEGVPTVQGSQWQPDGVGSLARIGVLTPDFDPVPESEMWAMAPRGVSIHAARVLRRGGARAFAEPPYVDDAAKQLVGLQPRAILYAFTSSSYALGANADESLRARLEKGTGGVPVILTCPASH